MTEPKEQAVPGAESTDADQEHLRALEELCRGPKDQAFQATGYLMAFVAVSGSRSGETLWQYEVSDSKHRAKASGRREAMKRARGRVSLVSFRQAGEEQ